MEQHEQNLLTQILFKADREEKVTKGETIIREGDVSKRSYYLKEGLLRGWSNNNGKETTFQFLFENQHFCSAESFFYGSPCSYSVEAVEESVLLSTGKKEMELLGNDKQFLTLFNKYLISRLAAYQQLLISRIQDKPEICYKTLLEENPEIIFRVPQHYIASFLGITAVSLSRIRNRR